MMWPDSIHPQVGAWQEALKLKSYQVSARERMVAIDAISRTRWEGWGKFPVSAELLPILQDALYEGQYGNLELVSWLPHIDRLSLNTMTPVLSSIGWRDSVPAKAITPNGILGFENRIPYSEDLSQSSVWKPYGGATATVTGGQPDPFGGTSAWRVQTSGGSNAAKFLNVSTGVPSAPLNVTYRVWLYVKCGGSQGVTIKTNVSSAAVTVTPAQGWVAVTIDTTRTVAGDPGIVLLTKDSSIDLDVFVFRPMFVLDPLATGETSRLGFPDWYSGWGYLPTGASRLDRVSRRYYAYTIGATGTYLFSGPRYANPVWLVADRGPGRIATNSDGSIYDITVTLTEV